MESTRKLVWFLGTTALFEDQTESILNWAGQEAIERQFDRGETLLFQRGGKDQIYVLLDGKVKLRSLAESGKEKILDIAGPGDTFGPLELVLTGEKATQPSELATEAVAMSKGTAIAYPIEEFRRLVEKRPKVVLNVSKLLGLKQRQFEIRLSRLLFRSSTGKVAGLLQELAERYGETTPEGTEINLKLTHQEIASMIGVKRETVSEALAELELQELISTRGKKFLLLQIEKLEQVV